MNISVAFMFCALLALPAAARTFTNSEGKTIEAEIVTATEGSVTLKLLSGKTSKVNLDKLSEADQAHVKAWIANKIPNLRVTPNFVRSNRDSAKPSSSYFSDEDRQVQVLDLSVHFETWDKARGVEGELKYILVGRSMEERGRYKILAVQKADFNLAPAGQTELNFKTVKNYYEDGQSRGKGARCVGYVLYASRKSDGREVYTSASTPVLEKAIYSIIALQTGEETDDNFIKVPDSRDRKRDRDSDVLTVQ